jgi:hypothetical protein
MILWLEKHGNASDMEKRVQMFFNSRTQAAEQSAIAWKNVF